MRRFAARGGRIVGVVPSYFMFQVYSEMYGRRFIKVPYNDDLSMDVNSIIAELTDETQLLILLNPNNPMGNVYTDEEFEKLFDIEDDGEEDWDEETQKDWDEKMNSVKPPKKE